jgi:hypothetical protein
MQDGERNEGDFIPCVPPPCPEVEEIEVTLHVMSPEEIEAFYASDRTIF